MDNINGIVIVNKEKGYTSHDVVNVMRKLFGIRKIGHTGTLDPDATGVLPICIGKATKVADMLTFSDKKYIARVRLGLTTDTQDISGEVIERYSVDVSYDSLKLVAASFVGEIEQIPPMYSAIKQGGKKLCDLARQGIEVERKPRKITIYSLKISDFDGVEFTAEVSCSKGTYIRTLCHDIGTKLGCGAVMTELVRSKSSIFDIENSYSLDSLKKMKDEGSLYTALISTDSVFYDYKRLVIDDKAKARLCNGAPCYVDCIPDSYRVYDRENNFLCVAKAYREGKQINLKSLKTFW